MEFEFDPDKSAANLAKHGIDFETAQRLWDDVRAVETDARDGASGEPRSLVVGMIEAAHWSAIVTFRNSVIRLISVRRSRTDEKELYDEQKD